MVFSSTEKTIEGKNANQWMDAAFKNYNMGLFLDAFTACDVAIQLKPESSDLWKFKGRMLIDLKRYEGSLVAYDHALNLNPNDTDSWCMRGYILNNLNRTEEALDSYNRVLQLNPDNDHALIAWQEKAAIFSHVRKQFEEAFECA